MGISILVVDANKDNGKLIQKSLEINGQFQVTLATRAIEALMRFTESKFRVAVIDFGLPDLNGVDLIRQMRGIDESIIIIAVLDGQESQTSDLEQLSVEVILDKPAYLGDLSATLVTLLNLPAPMITPDPLPPDPPTYDPAASKTETVLEDPAHKDHDAAEVETQQKDTIEQEVLKDRSDKTVTREDDPIPPWLHDPAQVEKHLTHLANEHSAYALLLSRGPNLTNFSETLSENQAQGIVRLLSEHNEGLQSKGALIRYIRLSGTGNDYLLYATPVVADINLTLIFSMETPFSVARRQAHTLSQRLAYEDPQSSIVQVDSPLVEKLVTISHDDDELLLPSEWIPGPKSPLKSSKPIVMPERIPAVDHIPETDPIQAAPSIEEQALVEPESIVEELPATEVSEEPPVLEPVPSTPDAEEQPVLKPAPSTPVAEELPVLEPVPAMPDAEEPPVLEPVPAMPDAEEMPVLEPVPAMPDAEEPPVLEPVPAMPVAEELPVFESVSSTPVAEELPVLEPVPAMPDAEEPPVLEPVPAMPVAEEPPVLELVPATPDAEEPPVLEPVPATPVAEEQPVLEPVPATPVAEELPVLEPVPAMPDAEEMPVLEPVPAMPDAEELPVLEPVRSTPVAEDLPVLEPVPSTPVAEEMPVLEPVPSTPVAEELPALEPGPSTPVAEELPAFEPVPSTPDTEEMPVFESVSSTPFAEEMPALPTDWLPKEPKPASHLPFLDPLPKPPERIIEPDPVNIGFQEPKYYLPFTAILLPRFPNHKLVGSLANQLETWLNDLCIAWGWRMATIDLRPEFLRFTVNLSPEVAPAQSIQSLAQNLSTRILQAFPGLAEDLPSGQFWTKSYLLTAGSDVGKDRLATFIETTRKEQGLNN